MSELRVGLVGEFERVVGPDHTATHLGSGSVDVLATPEMILWMEEASVLATNAALDAGQATVGTSVNVRHLAATPMGMRVRVRSELTTVEGRRLVFHVTAEDERERVGEGDHERFIIDVAKFKARVEGKRG
ncbi:MAG: thioesterase family protein [Anaerolineae bacterium]